MSMQQTTQSDLIDAIAAFQHDPLGFARFAFPWGEANTERLDAARKRVGQ